MFWCPIGNAKMIGPYFFRQYSVDNSAYKQMLWYYGLQNMQELPDSPILQHNSAYVHTHNTLKEFQFRKVGNNCNKQWRPSNRAARSPDLTQFDFFLWIYLEDSAYSEKIESLDHLLIQIRQAIGSMDSGALPNVWKHLNTRTNCVVRQEGKNFEQIKF